jgi:hypothetical protein
MKTTTSRKTLNPFYPALLVVGFIFAVTACAYGVMAVNLLSPAQVMGGEPPAGMIAFLDRHGMTLLLSELGVLAIVTCAAIGTDDYWNRGAAVAAENDASHSELPS